MPEQQKQLGYIGQAGQKPVDNQSTESLHDIYGRSTDSQHGSFSQKEKAKERNASNTAAA